MFKYVLKRLALLVFTFLVIITMCFILVKLLPLAPIDAANKDAAVLEARRELLGYNKPIIEQYFIFLRLTLFGGNWGLAEGAKYQGQEIMNIFLSKLPFTMYINFLAMLISVPIGLGLGIFAALKKNRWQDHLISTGVMIFISVPSYVYAFIVQYFICFKWKWLPLQMQSGYDFLSWSMFLSALPAILSLSFGTIAGLTRYTRAELTEVLTSEFMLLARTKGLTRAQATTRHALRNSMVPIFPSIISQFIGIIGGSLIIEQIFGVPGVGPLYIESITGTQPEYNLFMLLSGFYCLVGLLAGIIVDLSYGFIDPRIRMGAK